MSKFKVGDRVSFGGLKGTVVDRNDSPENYPVEVRFDNGTCGAFTIEGKLLVAHTKPLLKKLVKRKKISVDAFVDKIKIAMNAAYKRMAIQVLAEKASNNKPEGPVYWVYQATMYGIANGEYFTYKKADNMIQVRLVPMEEK